MLFINTFKDLFSVLAPPERQKVFLIALFALAIVITEMLSAAVLFLTVTIVSDFNGIESNPNYIFIQNIISLQPTQFVYLIITLMLAMMFVTITMRSFLIFIEARFMLSREYTIGRRILEKIIKDSYESIKSKNQAEITRIVLSDVVAVVENGLYPLNTIIIQSLLISGMFFVMLITDPIITIAIALLISSIYFFIYSKLSMKIDMFARKRLGANTQRFKIIENFFGIYKNAKIEGELGGYLESFSTHSKMYARSNANLLILASLPKGIVELFLVATSFLAFALIFLSDQVESLSVFSIFIFAGYKILPAAQSLYGALAKIRFVAPYLKAVLENIEIPNELESDEATKSRSFQGLSFHGVSFSYKHNSRQILNDVNISLPRVGYVGVVGRSGSGKTTLIDIMTGLIQPTIGSVFVHGEGVEKFKLKTSDLRISYLPQSVYLFDSTIVFNITLEANPDDLDVKRLELVLRQSGLSELIDRLPSGVLTTVGDQGSAISGGEKQRIGLARALYRDSDILILDEVTNGLDIMTQEIVLSAIERISKERLVISVSHVLEHLKTADKILAVSDNRVIALSSISEFASNFQPIPTGP